MSRASEQALFDGAAPARVLKFDSEAGILYLAPGETEMCPECRDVDQQSWECGESDCYEMTCQRCGFGYGVSRAEALP